MNISNQAKTNLRQKISESFDLEELRTLIFDLAIVYDDLRGETRQAKVTSLIDHIERTDRLPDLLAVLKLERPNIHWEDGVEALPIETPYKGLSAFTESEADLFYGREALVSQLVERIHQEHFLALVGPSGAGKSSVVHAGLIPTLRQQGDWTVYAITPTDSPLRSLATALTAGADSVTSTTALIDDLAANEQSLDLYARRLVREPLVDSGPNVAYQQYLTDLRQRLVHHFNAEDFIEICLSLNINPDLLGGRGLESQFRELITYLDRRRDLTSLVEYAMKERPKAIWTLPPTASTKSVADLLLPGRTPTKLLLVVDQFEELFILCRNLVERRAFVDNLMRACETGGNLHILIVLRADFYAHTSQYDQLREALAKHQVFVGLMRKEELRRAIVEPAQNAGLLIEPGLVEVMLNDIGDEPGALPLLSHTLYELWQRREGKRLTLNGYMSVGGIRGAIQQTADSTLQQLTIEEQNLAKQIFLGLTELGEGTQDTSRRVQINELMTGSKDALMLNSVLSKLADARLITVDLDYVEIAHEALIREWPTLRRWLDENREGLKIQRQLTAAALEWQRFGHDESYLYRGTRQEVAKEWAQTHPEHLSAIETEFLKASSAAAQAPNWIQVFLHNIYAHMNSVLLIIFLVSLIILIVFIPRASSQPVLFWSLSGLTITLFLLVVWRHNRYLYETWHKWMANRSRYQRFVEEFSACSPLEQLLLLQAPLNRPFAAMDLEELLMRTGAGVDAGSIQVALVSLTQKELLVTKEGTWEFAHIELVAKHQQALANEVERLASQTREQNPFFLRVGDFLEKAGISLTSTEFVPVYLGEATEEISPALNNLLSLPVHILFFMGSELDDAHILHIRQYVAEMDRDINLVLLITNSQLTDRAWAQIGTLRLGDFHILPIDNTLIDEGLANRREGPVLAKELEKRLGANFDPYDERAPVASAFSFFGREALVGQLLRRLESGAHLGIFGLRKMGKSSLLQALRDRSHFPVALVNLQGVSRHNLSGLYKLSLQYWAQWIYVHYRREWTPPEITAAETPDAFVDKLRDLLQWLERETGSARLGLFLDEVELIVPRPDERGEKLQLYLDLLRALRGLIEDDGRLGLIVASLNPSITRINNWGREQNPTYSLFRENNLPPLEREDCLRMIRNIGLQAGLTYDDETLAVIADLSGGHPFLARQFCSLLYRQREREPGCIHIEDVPAAVNQFIYDHQTVHHLDAGIWQDAGNEHLWGELTQAQENQALLLELAQADAPVARYELLRTNTPWRQEALIGLQNYHIIYQPESNLFAIKFGLLKVWLRQRKLGLEA